MVGETKEKDGIIMRMSQTGINMLKQFEGVRLTAYKAVSTEQYWTIGYGHYGVDVYEGMKITDKQAEEMLKNDLVRYENGVNESVTVTLGQNQFDALVSFAYNCGVSALKGSYLLNLINMGKFADACEEWLLWNKSGGKVLLGLSNRRKAEVALFKRDIETYTVVDSKGWITETGQFKLTQDIYLRKGATTDSLVIALLPKGSLIRYDAFKHAGGYVWIRQQRGRTYGYLATGESKNGKRINYWGTFR